MLPKRKINPEGIFPRHEACANLLGELTRPTAVWEATIEVRTSLPGQECQPTQLTRRAPGVGGPPRWRQADSLADESAHSAVTARGLLKGSTHADDGREPAALYACAVGSRPNGGMAEAQPRG